MTKQNLKKGANKHDENDRYSLLPAAATRHQGRVSFGALRPAQVEWIFFLEETTAANKCEDIPAPEAQLLEAGAPPPHRRSAGRAT